MKQLEEFTDLCRISLLTVLFVSTFQGSSCQLLISPVGPTVVRTLAGNNVTLAVTYSGASDPAITWLWDRLPVVTWIINSISPPDIPQNRRDVLHLEKDGSLTFIKVPLNYSSNYTVEMTKSGLGTASLKFTLQIFERPSGSPVCSVVSVNNDSLLYECDWMGGTPQATLSFPTLNSSSRGEGHFRLTLPASADLNGKTVTCQADPPFEQNTCNITARNPKMFLPEIGATVDHSNIVVSIVCVSEASPQAVVSWSNDGGAITNGTTYQISSNTTELKILHNNISNLISQNFTCTCSNLLGSQARQIQLQGPSISDSSLSPNQDGTNITLTWQVPPTSVVTGFDIQMKGPYLRSKNGNTSQAKSTLDGYRTIQQKPGSERSTFILPLDPKQVYHFRIMPKAHLTDGQPSMVHRIGPPDGLSGPAIAGIAAGIPCSILALLLVGGLIFLIIYLKKNKRRRTKYPVPRTAEKTITQAKIIQPEAISHKSQAGGLKFFPDCNRLHQSLSDRSVPLPAFVPPPPPSHVRVATTV